MQRREGDTLLAVPEARMSDQGRAALTASGYPIGAGGNATIRLRLDEDRSQPTRQRVPIALGDYLYAMYVDAPAAGDAEDLGFASADDAFMGWPYAWDLRPAVARWVGDADPGGIVKAYASA